MYNYSTESNEKNKRRHKSKTAKVRNKFISYTLRVIIVLVLVGGFAAGGAVVGAYLGIIENAPQIEPIRIMPNIFTSIIYNDKTGQETDRLKGEENREYATLERIPKHLRNAFIAIEDERFYSHDGVDFKGMLRAVYVSLTSSRKQGASTITQQLIKNNFTKVMRNSIETKIQEQYLAIEYEKEMIKSYGSKQEAKDKILEIYLNTIGLHHGLNGVQTAAIYYFGKDVSELTISESAVIAAITQIPTYYAPDIHPENNRERQLVVLKKMLEQELITQQEYDQAVADNVYDRISDNSVVQDETPSYHSYYDDRLVVEVARDLLENNYVLSLQEGYNWVYNAGLKIYSAQDLEMQAIMDRAYENDELFPAKDFEIDIQYTISLKNNITNKVENIYREGTVKTEEEIEGFVNAVKDEVITDNHDFIMDKLIPIPQPQSAMVIMDYYTGQVKALTGGRGQKLANRSLNRATDSERQPGSVFKVLASYAAAIDLGLVTPGTVIVDEPYTYKGYSPTNWYSGYRGPSTVRDGIRDSMNILAVKNMVDTGIETCFDYLKNFGFTTLVERQEIRGEIHSDIGPATALGGITFGVTQLEVAAAYGTIANQGQYNKPIFYTKVLDHDNKVLLDNTQQPRQVLKRQSAYLLTDMMKDVVTSGTGRKAAFQEVKMPIAGKTGTTTDTIDLTFVGYTPYYVGSIYLGYDHPKTIKEDTGYHMVLWRTIMEEIHRNLEYKDFEKPDGLVNLRVCNKSGKLAVVGLCDQDYKGDATRSDIFIVGTQPTASCDLHTSVTIDTSTGMLANPYCPDEVRQTVIGVTGFVPDEESDQPAFTYIECTTHGPFGFDNDRILYPDDIFSPGGSQAPVYPYDQPQEQPTQTPSGQGIPNQNTPSQGQQGNQPLIPDSGDSLPSQDSQFPSNNPADEAPTMDEPLSIDNFSY